MGDFPVEIVDSRSVAMGLGFIALAAARAAERGLDYLEVAQAARALVPKMRILFIVDTLEYLHKGGRIGGASRLVGTALSIKPILQIEDGRIETLMKVRTKRKAVGQAMTILEEDMSGKADVHVAIIHAAAEQEGARILDEVKGRLNPSVGILTELTPVVGTHSGPGVVGFIYYAGEG
jgi:DegV family protein with EDD domain